MNAIQLLAMMATLQCHTITVDIPAERQTIAYTVCVKVEVTPLKEKTKQLVKRATKKKVTRCKRKYYWKNHHKRWRCVR